MSRDLLVVIISLFTWGIGEGMFIYFQPLYLQQLGADPLAIGAILGTMGVVMMLVQTPAGYLADRFGNRPVMWTSWILGLFAAWVMALSNGLPVFVIGLLLYGMTSFVTPPLNAYVTQARGSWSVARALTTGSGVFQLGAVIGPLIGGQLGQAHGLKTVYLIASGVLAVSVLIVLFARPQPVHAGEPGQPRANLLRNRRFTAFLSLMFVALAATYLPQPLTPNFLQNQHHLSLVAIGQLGSIGSLGNAVLSLGLGHLEANLAFVIGQVAVGVFSVLLWRGSGMPWFAVGYFFFGGYRVCRLMAVALTRPLVRQAEVGLAYGVLETVNGASVILAPMLAGLLYQADPYLVYPVSLAALAVSLVATGWFLLGSRSQAHLAAEVPDNGQD